MTWVKGRYADARHLRSGATQRWKLPADAYMLLHTTRRVYGLARASGRPRLYSTSLR